MFFLETKDGDKFFTENGSDDRQEFAKILDEKLGQSSVELFDMLMDEISEKNESLLKDTNKDLSEIIQDMMALTKAPEIKPSDLLLLVVKIKAVNLKIEDNM